MGAVDSNFDVIVWSKPKLALFSMSRVNPTGESVAAAEELTEAGGEGGYDSSLHLLWGSKFPSRTPQMSFCEKSQSTFAGSLIKLSEVTYPTKEHAGSSGIMSQTITGTDISNSVE
jgi:hypothetical protein